MIPLKLQIKNFLSYGPETQIIDFTPYNLICLVGKNGHGKSAMLDAITWAVWGQARKTGGTSKADEGLVHLGQKQMLIIFEFQIHETVYKIRREFVKTQSHPFAALDFGIIKSDQTFIALTDKTIKATQEKIETTIGISYDSFINSAFLRQGQANEFSKKSAKERKEILGTILHLDQFENLKKIALEKNKSYQQTLLHKQNIQNRITQEIENLKIAITDKHDCQEKITATEKRHHDITKEIEFLEKRKLKIQEDTQQFEFLSYQKKEIEQKIQELSDQIILIQDKYNQVEKNQSLPFDVTTIQKKHADLRATINNHQEKLNKRLELKDTYLKIQEKKQLLEKELYQEVQAVEKKRENAMKIIQEKIDYQKINLTNTITNLHNCNQEQIQLQQKIDDHTNILTIIIEKQNILKKEEESLPKLIQDLEKINIQIQVLTTNIGHTKEKKSKLSEKNNSCCPLCEQELSTTTHKNIDDKLTEDLIQDQKNLELYQNQAIEQTRIIQEKNQAHQSISLLQKEFEKHTIHLESFQEKYKNIEKIASEHAKNISIFQKIIAELEQELLTTSTTTKSNQISTLLQEKENELLLVVKNLEQLKEQGISLGYDKNKHEQDLDEFKIVEKNLDLYHTLQKEIVDQQQRLIVIEKYKQEIITYTRTHQDILEKIKKLGDVSHALQKIITEEKELKKILQEIIHLKTDLISKQAIINVHELTIIKLETEQTALIQEISSLNSEIIDLQEIAKALGKDGLQALLIEQAIPEIEEQANELLAQLTDNQTQIFIESLRDLKKGGSKETLDIKISDAVGLRPYEMFSGGEAFRIDFALRIAISKLLARRAGTALQTLIIDEGFGSQDDDGLQLIMDSILKIQDNFAKVIIVSHLPSMKEQFPVQFLVQKKASGSTITIIEQG